MLEESIGKKKVLGEKFGRKGGFSFVVVVVVIFIFFKNFFSLFGVLCFSFWLARVTAKNRFVRFFRVYWFIVFFVKKLKIFKSKFNLVNFNDLWINYVLYWIY